MGREYSSNSQLAGGNDSPNHSFNQRLSKFLVRDPSTLTMHAFVKVLIILNPKLIIFKIMINLMTTPQHIKLGGLKVFLDMES